MRLGQSRGIIKAVETVYVALRDEGVDVWAPSRGGADQRIRLSARERLRS
jgi:hypothetical protein